MMTTSMQGAKGGVSYERKYYSPTEIRLLLVVVVSTTDATTNRNVKELASLLVLSLEESSLLG